jgi:WD40 repeat protein
MVVASLIIGISLSVWQAIEATRAEKQSNANAILAQQNSELAEQRAIEARESEVNTLRRAYNSDMSLAFRALEDNLFGRVQESVRQHVPKPGEPDFRGWEWRYAWAQSRSDAVLIWDTPADMDEVFAIRISPDQRYLVSCEFNPGPWTGGFIRRLWNFQAREELKHIHLPVGSLHGFAFSNSGKYLALHRGPEEGVNEICIYDTSKWDLETPPAAVLWDWRGQAIIHEWPVQSGKGAHHDDVVFFPDGQRLAIGGLNELQIVDTSSGSTEHRQPAPDGGITALAISPDSRYVAIGAGYEIHEIGLLNTASWEQEPPLTGHGGWVTSLTFSANSQRLISSSTDNTIRVWDMNSRVTTRILKGHQSEVFSVLLTSDESRAVSSGKDKRILEWDLIAPPPFQEHVLAEPVRQVVFSPDSQSFYAVDDSGSIGIWDMKTFAKQHSSSSKLGDENSFILSGDGEHLIAGNGSGQLWVLDARDLQVVAHRSVQSGKILPMGFSADGRSLVVLESGNNISLWNVETWQLRSRVETGLNIQYHTKKNYCAIPHGSDILLYPSGADLAWWDLEQSQELATLRINSRRSGVIAISPTEPLLASAARGDFVTLWNWQTRKPAGRFRGPRAFMSVAFSPDGRRLVTGSNGKESLIIWDVSTKQEIARCGTSVSTLQHSVQFSPDGNIVCAVDNARTAYFLRAPSFEEINDLEAEQRKKEESL